VLSPPVLLFQRLERSPEKSAMRTSKAGFLILGLLPLAACITAARPDDGQASSKHGKAYPLDNFENTVAANNVGWWASADQNNLGSTATFTIEPAVDGTTGAAGHLTGHLGRSSGKTYSWASLGLATKPDNSPANFSGVKMIRFRVKGDGGKYRLALPRDAVKDYGNFAAPFAAPKTWTTVEIRMDSLAQPSWAQQLPHVFTDVKSIEIAPLDEGNDFNLYVDDVELVISPNKPNPFEIPDEPPAKLDGKAIVLDDFEGKGPINGGVWGAEMDTNNLGTVASYRAEDSEDPTRKTAGHLSGKLGKNIAKLWPWASLAINIEPNATPTDLSAVKGIRFWAKGSGVYRAVITRKAVTDYGNFGKAFGGPKEWKQIVIPLDKMTQADWAQKVPEGFPDAISFEIQPTTANAPFELWVDDVEFVVDPSKPSPFKAK
jgi:hypothetical protein